jgi:demethylmenaquinone methyltransferase/2-methoxy-6-polyprenyl-1,4-benzoquinol methylase
MKKTDTISGGSANIRESRRGRRPLKRMFDAVPDRYDLLNRLLTLRLDERWRSRAADLCIARNPSRVLDLCCGTGDLAIHLRRRAPAPVEVFGLDYSQSMLDIAREKVSRKGLEGTVQFVEGDAGHMDFPDEYFDVVGIAFGFRNITWKNPIKDQALAEVRRVLRTGGAFVIVETSQPTNELLRFGFHAYLKTAVAMVGGAISGNGGAYRYLAESARRFFSADEVSSMLSAAGLEPENVEKFFGGVAAIHTAVKTAA